MPAVEKQAEQDSQVRVVLLVPGSARPAFHFVLLLLHPGLCWAPKFSFPEWSGECFKQCGHTSSAQPLGSSITRNSEHSFGSESPCPKPAQSPSRAQLAAPVMSWGQHKGWATTRSCSLERASPMQECKENPYWSFKDAWAVWIISLPKLRPETPFSALDLEEATKSWAETQETTAKLPSIVWTWQTSLIIGMTKGLKWIKLAQGTAARVSVELRRSCSTKGEGWGIQPGLPEGSKHTQTRL